ncbi:MAG: LamG domain-containing protein [Planctomycetes bacterium]|nr:LamG domain-containing protein [Planctomycetota bacterium]
MTEANLIEGITGPAFYFDGVDDGLDLEDITTDFTKGVTICSWVNFHVFNFYGRIIDIGAGERSNNIAFHNYMSSDSLGMHIYNDKIRSIADYPGLTLNEWSHLCGTGDTQGTIILYKDGIPMGIDTGNFVPKDVIRDSSYIAKSPWQIDDYFKGDLDEIRVWNKAISGERVKLQYETQKPGAQLIHIVTP